MTTKQKQKTLNDCGVNETEKSIACEAQTINLLTADTAKSSIHSSKVRGHLDQAFKSDTKILRQKKLGAIQLLLSDLRSSQPRSAPLLSIQFINCFGSSDCRLTIPSGFVTELSKFTNSGSAEALFNNFCEDKTRSKREMASKLHNPYEAQLFVNVFMEAALVPEETIMTD